MAAKIHGRLAAADLAATTNTTVYAVPSARKATVNVSICNRTTGSLSVRLAHIDAATVGSVANEDYMEYDTIVPANQVLERTGITMTAGHCLGAYASGTGLSVVVHGIEEDA